jgi:hypothetical protein
MNSFYDELVPISLIRTHTKTDDILSVTDEQLELYRQSAIEAAQLYTGYLIDAYRDMTLRLPYKNSNKRTVTYTLPHHAAAETVYWREGRQAGSSMIPMFSRRLKINNVFYNAGINSCCEPCGSTHNLGLVVTYKTGFKCAADVPASIKLGILKFIAWSVANAGDEVVTLFTGETRLNSASSYGIAGTNNTAWASGAIELWRQFDEEA